MRTHFPDLEYYYLYQQLDTGGLLVLDDIQIPTIRKLFDFLASDAMFELEDVVDTTAFFTRTDAPMFSPTGDSWWEQEFNKQPADMDGVANPIKKLNQLQETIQLQENALSAKEREIEALNATLKAIYDSHGWKALSLYYRLRDGFLRKG